MKQSDRDYKRIVVKIGSSLFCSQGQGLDLSLFRQIALQVSDLSYLGKEIIIVSSGAIALGMNILKLKTRPKELSFLQAAAALGQNVLMDKYSEAAKDLKTNFAQVLLTWDDFDDRKRYLNARNTIRTLLKLKSVPIINENDTVSTEEIKFGDNDRLSALVASLISADLLVILSDVDGLLDKEGKLIKIVDQISPQIKALASPTSKKTCVGGMVTKVEAAKIAVDSGIPCVIANGRSQNMITRIAKDPYVPGTWTLFLPKKDLLAAKKRWIAFGTKPKGKIIVDEGARAALMNKKSLLCVGVVGARGDFEAGDIVSVLDKQEQEFARGKAGISCKKLEETKGKRYDKEIIHRDNIVII